MERGLLNITDENVHILIDLYSTKPAVKNINICNSHASIGAKVRLFLDDGTNQTSYIENVVIPAGVTLLVTDISFDNSVCRLAIQVEDAAGGSTVDTNLIMR